MKIQNKTTLSKLFEDIESGNSKIITCKIRKRKTSSISLPSVWPAEQIEKKPKEIRAEILVMGPGCDLV